MEQNIFTAGVNPGSPISQTEIKTLLCYIVSNVSEPMSFMQMYDALGENSLVNYFELVGAVEELCRSGHLSRGADSEDDAEYYQATDLGNATGRELSSSIPAAVREKAMEGAQKVIRRKHRESEVRVTQYPQEAGGFVMEFAIPDSGIDLIRFSLFVPSQEECARMKRRFLNAPLFIYQEVLSLLTGDRQPLGMEYPEEELF